MNVADLGDRIRKADSVALKQRWVLEFIDEYRAENKEVRATLLIDEPAPTGDQRWDAFLAGLADHLAYHDGFLQPPWTEQPNRFLKQFWFIPNTPSTRAEAIAHAPATFRRRGVFITPDLFWRA